VAVLNPSNAIPAVTVGSQNVRGFSAYGRDGARCAAKISNATALISRHHLTYFQETNLLDREDHFFKTFLPKDHSCYYSSLSKTTAGVAIVISPHVNSLYNHKVVPLPKSLDGYALCVVFSAKDGTHTFAALNLYLDSSGFPARTIQLTTLQESVPPSPYLIVGGDLNFVEDKYNDTSSQSTHYDSTRAFASAWTNFKVFFSLKEVIQKTHTYISDAGNPDTAITSRLDRFYLSYSEVDWAIVKPFAYISTIPNTILHSVTATHPLPSLPPPPPPPPPPGPPPRRPPRGGGDGGKTPTPPCLL
jgi:hypothetical protein